MLGFIAILILFSYWILLCFILPYRAKRVYQQSQPKPKSISRTRHYKSCMINLSCLAAFAILVAYSNHLPVFGSIHIDSKISLFALGFLAVNMLLIEPLEWKCISDEIKQRYGNLSPHTAKERFVWIGVSVVAALSEEILYRAVFFGIFYQLTGSYWIAGWISAAFFAVAHAKYGLAALPSALFVALGLQYFMVISGGLYISIAIHFIHNVINGIVYGGIWERKLKAEIAKNIIPDNTKMAAIAQAPD